ncbi:MAG TPA: DUF2459 domain-containing protein, partial [Caulobacteraceae bacterium]|nr:DUF2459 domain-containing protein [Caulobacteraceae bacterium]
MKIRRPWRTAITGTLLLLLLLALSTAKGGDRRLYPPGADAVTVYLVDNGWHSDLALPRSALGAGPAGRAVALAGPGPWVMVGFGDTRFFMATSPPLSRAGDGLRALFAPDNPAAIRFDALAARPDRLWRDGVTPVRLSPAGLAAVVARIDRSIALDG